MTDRKASREAQAMVQNVATLAQKQASACLRREEAEFAKQLRSGMAALLNYIADLEGKTND